MIHLAYCNGNIHITSGNARFSQDGTRLEKVGSGSNTVTISYNWRDNSRDHGDGFIINGVFWDNKQGGYGDKGSMTKEVDITPAPQPVSVPSTSSDAIQKRLVFDTIKGINSANRPLWRINPTAGRDAGFLSQYGVLPFDPTTTTDEYAGTHEIIWNNINFPVDGNYTIEMMVDDSVVLYLKKGNVEEFYIRAGGSSASLTPSQMMEYINQRFN